MWWLALVACTVPATTLVDVHGTAVKGPLREGSDVIVQPIDASGQYEGAPFVTTTTSDLGLFGVEGLTPGPVRVEATGRYWSETRFGPSVETITLAGIGAVDPAAPALHVNTLTHLVEPRVQALLVDGVPLGAARDQAEAELVAALAIGTFTGDEPWDPSRTGLYDGDAAAAWLFAVSTVLAVAAERFEGGGVPLEDLLDWVRTDLADDGSLEPELWRLFARIALTLDTDPVTDTFAAWSELHGAAPVPDLRLVLPDYDADGDGSLDADLCGDPGICTDCDDADPALHPGATEVPYDGIDQDCDGHDLVDVDGDGVPGGVGAMDCDDTDATAFPGAPELCDGGRNDCGVTSWTSADEDGLVSRLDTGADLTATFAAGTSTAPATIALGPASYGICSGTWYVALQLVGTGTWHLDGPAGADATALDGGGVGRVVMGAEGGELHVSGLTIQNGWLPDGTGAGIHKSGGVLVLSDSVVAGNVARDGAGVYSGAAATTITDTVFEGNRARSTGGGLQTSGPSATLTRVEFRGNVTHSLGGGAAIHGGPVSFSDVEFVGNTNVEEGGTGVALYCDGCSLTAERTTITGHLRTPVYMQGGSMRFVDSDLSGNAGQPALFRLYGGEVELVATRVVQNAGTPGVIDLDGLSRVTCDGSTVADNATGVDGIVRILDYDARFVADPCDFGEGDDDNVGADVWVEGTNASYFYSADTTVTCVNNACL